MPTPGDGFKVQVEDFAAAAPTFLAAGHELTDVDDLVQTRLASLGAFWGTTAHGPEFGEKYQEYAAKVHALAQACGIDLQATGTGLADMGKQYGATEDAVTQSLRKIRAQ